MKNKSKTVNFVLNIDSTFVEQSVVTMTSILHNLNRMYRAHFYVLFKWFKTKPREYTLLEQKYKCSITCINANQFEKIFSKVDLSKLQQTQFQKHWVSNIAFYRLLMFKFLPSNVTTAFYIDSDAVVDGDLSNVYEEFVETNKLFATVVDLWFLKIWRKNKKYYERYSEFSKLVENRLKYAYFCSGFYIANIKKCKEMKIYEQLLSFFAKHPDVKLADQDILNAIFSQKYYDQIIYLPLEYDLFMDTNPISFRRRNKFFYPRKQIYAAYKKPIVLHYGGQNKPWVNGKCKQGPEKWWYYYNISPLQKKNNK